MPRVRSLDLRGILGVEENASCGGKAWPSVHGLEELSGEIDVLR